MPHEEGTWCVRDVCYLWKICRDWKACGGDCKPVIPLLKQCDPEFAFLLRLSSGRRSDGRQCCCPPCGGQGPKGVVQPGALARSPSAGHQPAAVHTAAAMLADDLQSVVKDYKQLMTGLWRKHYKMPHRFGPAPEGGRDLLRFLDGQNNPEQAR